MPSSVTSDIVPVPSAPTPAKRGRKPGPLSRSAREAQRRLNHSIIEKARRTKINDALATLKQLVPIDYGSAQPQNELEDDDDDDDDEYPEEGTKRSKSKSKPKGKREEKEKEFKLEILVRTVSFLQDLLQRVRNLEDNVPACHHCEKVTQSSKKRKHSQVSDESDNGSTSPTNRNAEGEHTRKIFKSQLVPTETNGNGSGARLPSISSWLPSSDPVDSTVISPQLKPISPLVNPYASPPNFDSIRSPQTSLTRTIEKPKPSSLSPNVNGSYLPSPPASTHFIPIRASQIPPDLNLGPVATAAMVTPPPPPRTSEDESAASLLLEIASSPPFRPSFSTNSHHNLPDPSTFMLPSNQRPRVGGHDRQPQTPSSLLGLHQERRY